MNPASFVNFKPYITEFPESVVLLPLLTELGPETLDSYTLYCSWLAKVQAYSPHLSKIQVGSSASKSNFISNSNYRQIWCEGCDPTAAYLNNIVVEKPLLLCEQFITHVVHR